jgi:hypothetical protein
MMKLASVTGCCDPLQVLPKERTAIATSIEGHSQHLHGKLEQYKRDLFHLASFSIYMVRDVRSTPDDIPTHTCPGRQLIRRRLIYLAPNQVLCPRTMRIIMYWVAARAGVSFAAKKKYPPLGSSITHQQYRKSAAHSTGTACTWHVGPGTPMLVYVLRYLPLLLQKRVQLSSCFSATVRLTTASLYSEEHNNALDVPCPIGEHHRGPGEVAASEARCWDG